jgi:Family of unknown function (DUF5309)
MPVGIFNTAVIPQDLAKKSFSAAITRLMPNGSAPLFGLTALLKEETALQIEHGFYSKTMLFPSVVVSAAGQTNADSIFTVASTANILPGMILRCDTTNENILVLGLVSPTQLSVQRSLGNIAAQAIGASVSLWMVGNAYEESSLRPASLIIVPQRVTNFTQIFRNTWSVSESTRATMLLAGDTAVAESRQDCAAFHAVDIEKAFFFGQRFLGNKGGQPLRTMDGVISAVTQNNPGNITTLGGTTNFTQLEAALDPCFNQVTDPKNIAERILFVGGVMRRVIHAIARLNSTYFIEGDKSSWGLQIDTIKIPRGYFTLIEHPLFNAYGNATTWAKMGIALDLSTFNKAYLTGRDTVSREFNTNGQPVDNGIDAVGGTLTSELTCLVKNPAADAVLYNATAGLAG